MEKLDNLQIFFLHFRVWDKEEKRMYYKPEIHAKQILEAQSNPDRYIFMSWTGRFDSKGDQIYTGDILEFTSFIDGTGMKHKYHGVATFFLNRGIFGYEFKTVLPGKLITTVPVSESIIGNIYENPA